MFVSFAILFPGFLVQIPRAKVALVWYKHPCVIYTLPCNSPPICADCFFLSLLPIVAANQQSWISRFTSYLQCIAVPVAAAHAQFRAIGVKSARRRRHAGGGPWGPRNSWRGVYDLGGGRRGVPPYFNTGSRGSDVVNDIAQRQQILMSSG